MNRRRFLLGLTGGLALLSGYQISENEKEPRQSPSPPPNLTATAATNSSQHDQQHRTEQTMNEAHPVNITTSIGDTPHTISPTGKPAEPNTDAYPLIVRNRGNSRVVNIRLQNDDQPATPLLQRAYRFEPDTHLRIEIAVRGQYTAKLSREEITENSKSTTEVTMSFRVVDGERGATQITITEKGVETKSRSVSTQSIFEYFLS